MLIYNKLEDSIDIYNMEAKNEEIKKYRERVLHRCKKQEPLFYYLKTNHQGTVASLKDASNIDIQLLNYDNSTPLDCGTWSNLYEIQPKDLDVEQEDVIEAYIEGYYDKLQVAKVFQYNWKSNSEEELLRLLKPKNYYISSTNSHGDVYEIDEMLSLPRNLYLLHLLKQGKYAKVADENITKLLKMFEVEYVKNIKLKEIEEMLETGLVDSTIEKAIKKAETASKVFQKIKK